MTKKSVFISALLPAWIFLSCSRNLNPGVIIPAPQSIEWAEGVFQIEGLVAFQSNLDEQGSLLLTNILDHSPISYGIGIEARQVLEFELMDVGQFPLESYRLNIAPDRITIKASDEAGLFYGLQSLIQLVEYHGGKIPAQIITDSPRFAYRGFMLDVSRHFATVDFVKKQLDAMARYKLNRFHWHLVDGAGWRLEIKKYPLLTEVAAWRPYNDWKEWQEGGKLFCRWDDPRANGGFYTAADVKEVLDYAARLHIEVIPEIELPGHSLEVTAVYPELSCTGEPVWEVCIGNEKTFEFFENVLLEVMEMFPSQYIHIGGDEASRGHWKDCSKCQARIKTESLVGEDGLQSYMIERIEKFLNSHGREIIGWDEILDGGLAPNATVMSWRGAEGGIKAAGMGHDAIMTPGGYCYLDSYQDAPPTQPEAMPVILTTQKVYSYDPAPDTLPQSVRNRIIGIQGNLWRERIATEEHTEYMMYPRLIALAEVAWTEPRNKDYADFYVRVLRHIDWLREKGYHPFDLTTEVGPRPEAGRKWKNKALGKAVEYLSPYHQKYTAAGNTTLTDGLCGDWSYGDKRWQGFLDCDFDVIIDMGKPTAIKEIYAEFMQSYSADIWTPAEVIISVSDDHEHYTELKRQFTAIDFKSSTTEFETFGWNGECTGRYIRVTAKSNGHPGGWIFTDEIFIK